MLSSGLHSSDSIKEQLHCPYQQCTYVAPDGRVLIEHLTQHLTVPQQDSGNTVQYENGEDYKSNSVSNSSILPSRSFTTPKLNPEYKCSLPSCKYIAHSRKLLEQHILIHSGKKPYQCTQEGCTYASYRKYDIISHIKNKHQGITLPDIDSIVPHTDGPSETKAYRCTYDGCYYSTNRSSDLNSHLLMHTGERPFPCTVGGCSYYAPRQSDLSNHIRVWHPDEYLAKQPFEAQFKKIVTPSKLKTQLVCEQEGCSFTTTSTKTLFIHMCEHRGIKPYPCPFNNCPLGFNTKYHLKRHLYVHTGEKPFHCPIENCTYASSRESGVRGHLKSKHPQYTQPYTKEDFLNKSKINTETTAASQLSNISPQLTNNNNQSVVTSNVTSTNTSNTSSTSSSAAATTNNLFLDNKTVSLFECNHNGCNYGTTQKDCLEKHLEKHNSLQNTDNNNGNGSSMGNSTDKPYKCDKEYCDFSTSNPYYIAQHIKNHDKLTVSCPYVCEDNHEIPLDNLKPHLIKCHTYTDPIPCNYCGCQTVLTSHEDYCNHFQTHFHNKTYKCPFKECPFTTVKETSLRKHIVQHNNGQYLRCPEMNCSYVALKQELLTLHLMNHYQNNNKCTQSDCDFQCDDKLLLISHRLSHPLPASSMKSLPSIPVPPTLQSAEDDSQSTQQQQRQQQQQQQTSIMSDIPIPKSQKV